MDLMDTQSTCASDFINSTIVHDTNDTKVILHTLRSYGLIFSVSLLAFCFLRQWFPRVYNIRNWVEEYKSPLAADQRGFVSWMWKLYFLTETELRDECGMDALCYSRIFDFGIKIAAIGIFHSIWLMPVYATESLSPLNQGGDDPIATVSISNIPSGSNRFIATVVAAYFTFFAVMYLMRQEIEWFTRARHEFITLLLPRNYTVYVQSVPEELRNNFALLQFFQEGLSQNTVQSAHLVLTVSRLKALQKTRNKVLDKLEHEIDVSARRNTHISRATDLESINGNDGNHEMVVDSLYLELEEANRQVSDCIDEIERRADLRLEQNNDQAQRAGPSAPNEGMRLLEEDEKHRKNTQTNQGEFQNPSVDEDSESHHSTLDVVTDTLLSAAHTVEEWSEHFVRGTGRAVVHILSNEDGRVLPSAFVTFTSLRGTHSTLQMIQYPEFYAMKVFEAPQPEDILWSNVGRPHQELKILSVISRTLTLAACFLWTIPMAMIASIANLNGLRAQFLWIDELLTKYPRLEVFFSQLAPLLILVAGQLIYLVVYVFVMLEGPISGAVLQTRMFDKLCFFQIIQTFFISAISGSILSVLSDLVAMPSCIVQLLATSLPGQSSFFIQLILVHTFAGMSSELLRPAPILLSMLRSIIGPRASERERRKSFLFLRPLADPVGFYQCIRLSITVLYFMVYFVYTTIAPISNFFILPCLLIQKSCIVHQLVHIYPPFPDSGGKLWMHFFGFIPWGMLISQATIIGMLGLKGAGGASIAMTPLFGCTFLFWYFIRQEHFKLATLLSAKECNDVDRKNSVEGVNWRFLQGKYVQPELAQRLVYPENGDSLRLSRLESSNLLIQRGID